MNYHVLLRWGGAEGLTKSVWCNGSADKLHDADRMYSCYRLYENIARDTFDTFTKVLQSHWCLSLGHFKLIVLSRGCTMPPFHHPNPCFKLLMNNYSFSCIGDGVSFFMVLYHYIRGNLWNYVSSHSHSSISMSHNSVNLTGQIFFQSKLILPLLAWQTG